MLKSLKEPLTNKGVLDNLSYVGHGIKQKINEYLTTGKMSKVEFLSTDKKLKAKEELSSVWGVGPSGADKLFSLGIASVQDLREKGTQYLNKLQRIGLQYHEDIIQRIPR
jgi:DNA polymerase/3'-5' exonuclease PolX